MPDDIVRILGIERAMLEADVPMLREALLAIGKEKMDLVKQEQELEALEGLIISTKRLIEELQREAFELVGNRRRSPKDIEDFTRKFFTVKKEADLIIATHYRFAEAFKKKSEQEVQAKPLFQLLQTHATKLHSDVKSIHQALYGDQSRQELNETDVAEYVTRFNKLHPQRN